MELHCGEYAVQNGLQRTDSSSESLSVSKECTYMQVKELWAAVTTAESPEALSRLLKDTAKLLGQLQDCPRARILRAAAQLRCGAWDGACSSAAAAGEWPSARIKLQAWWINCECLYAQGDLDKCGRRLEGGLDMLRKLEAENGVGGNVGQLEEDCLPLPASARVQDLASKMQAVLQCKQLGNAAFQQKDYPEAERQYTAALAVREVAAPVFSAVLYSNRAAVHMVRSLPLLNYNFFSCSVKACWYSKKHSDRARPVLMYEQGWKGNTNSCVSSVGAEEVGGRFGRLRACTCLEPVLP